MLKSLTIRRWAANTDRSRVEKCLVYDRCVNAITILKIFIDHSITVKSLYPLLIVFGRVISGGEVAASSEG